MMVSNLQYEISKLISEEKEKQEKLAKKTLKLQLSSLYGKYGQKG